MCTARRMPISEAKGEERRHVIFCGFSEKSAVLLTKRNVHSLPNGTVAGTIPAMRTLPADCPTPPTDAPSSGARVAVLLATLDGERFLPPQLDSIAAQSHRNWTMWASDDASADRTRAILDDYRARWSTERGAERIHITAGPARGFVANFLSLACNPRIDADYFAFCDQDDVWEQDKLARALAHLAACDPSRPALYCSRTMLIDETGAPIGFSPRFTRPPGFANALVQSLAGGNTMVFNRSARALLMRTGAAADVITHDWWVYLLVSGCGGTVLYDLRPGTRYRQHAHNLIGSNRGWRARLERISMLFRGHFRRAIDLHFNAIAPVMSQLTDENRELLERFRRARAMRLLPRLRELRRCGLYRQTLLGNLGLLAGTCFNKI